MSMSDIQNALIKVLKDNFLPAWDNRIAWENVSFKPLAGQPWMAFFFMPVEESILTLGPDGLDNCEGIVQIDVNYPPLAGEGSLRETINTLRACYRPQVIGYGGQSVTILSRSRNHGRMIDGYFKIAFTVRWRAQLPRTV